MGSGFHLAYQLQVTEAEPQRWLQAPSKEIRKGEGQTKMAKPKAIKSGKNLGVKKLEKKQTLQKQAPLLVLH
jgi:hypothetical protein